VVCYRNGFALLGSPSPFAGPCKPLPTRGIEKGFDGETRVPAHVEGPTEERLVEKTLVKELEGSIPGTGTDPPEN
jgi:hypothetical protein